MRPYFAYGANMVAGDMAARCPAARLVGPAVLEHHRFAIIRGGHGTVFRQRGQSVHGVLWLIGPRDEAALDRYEEVATGLYRRERRVVTSRGRPVAVLVYVAASKVPGRARAAYLAGIVSAARTMGFPDDYVAALQAIAGEPAAVSARDEKDRRNQGPTRKPA